MSASRFDSAGDAFEQGYARLRAAEGGYAKNNLDRGGETYAGISRRWWPDWDGWRVVDSYKVLSHARHNLGAALDLDITLRRKVRDFYRRYFWEPMGLDELPGPVAILAFDFAVNSGGDGIRLLQEALSDLTGEMLVLDGLLGPKTRAAVVGFCADRDQVETLVRYALDLRGNFYRAIVASDPDQERFLAGWLRRNQDLADYLGGETRS